MKVDSVSTEIEENSLISGLKNYHIW